MCKDTNFSIYKYIYMHAVIENLFKLCDMVYEETIEGPCDYDRTPDFVYQLRAINHYKNIIIIIPKEAPHLDHALSLPLRKGTRETKEESTKKENSMIVQKVDSKPCTINKFESIIMKKLMNNDNYYNGFTLKCNYQYEMDKLTGIMVNAYVQTKIPADLVGIIIEYSRIVINPLCMSIMAIRNVQERINGWVKRNRFIHCYKEPEFSDIVFSPRVNALALAEMKRNGFIN